MILMQYVHDPPNTGNPTGGQPRLALPPCHFRAEAGLRRGCSGASSNLRGQVGPGFPCRPAITPPSLLTAAPPAQPRHSSLQPRHYPAIARCSPVTAPPLPRRDPRSCFPGRVSWPCFRPRATRQCKQKQSLFSKFHE